MSDTATSSEFHAACATANVAPLWERYHRRQDNKPRSEPAFHWSWSSLEPMLDRAVAATSTDVSERRVLTLNNPAFDADMICATTNLNAGLQILMPGERARPHRHSMNALRFVIEGSGATTIVDGKPCPMEVGDMILTPAWTWHEHVHEGEGRTVWLDSLDVPIVDHLGAGFFEPGPVGDVPDLPPDDAFTSAGFAPPDADAMPAADYSPLFRYPRARAEAALAALTPAEDGSRTLRYVNPATGGAVMSLLDCFLLGLPKGVETKPYRSTSNGVVYVVAGEGATRVGDWHMSWSRNDVFTLPHWNWITHIAASDDTRLFLITDREVLRRLALLRDETMDYTKGPG